MTKSTFLNKERPAFSTDTKSGKLKPSINFMKIYPIFMNEPSNKFAGSEIRKLSKLDSGVVYPLLRGLENKGWLYSEWEKVCPSDEGRPRKKFYWPTPEGIKHGRKILDEDYPALRDFYLSNGLAAV